MRHNHPKNRTDSEESMVQQMEYSMKSVHQISYRKKQPLYLLFVELTVAFDCIRRKGLFDSIRLRIPEGESCSIS